MISISSCSLLEQTQEYERFIQCDFSLKRIDILEVGGVNVSVFEKPEEIGMLTMMSLMQQVLNGSLPAKLSISLNAKNNNTRKASIAGMDWQLFIKEKELLNGMINQTGEVPPASTTSFPIVANIDVLQLFDSQSLDYLLDFVFSENKEDVLEELGVAVKIKPYYKDGLEIKKYPGYITIGL